MASSKIQNIRKVFQLKYVVSNNTKKRVIEKSKSYFKTTNIFTKYHDKAMIK